jgi:hypothetical protein
LADADELKLLCRSSRREALMQYVILLSTPKGETLLAALDYSLL